MSQSQIICSPYLTMCNLIAEYLPLPQLQKMAQHLAAHAFHPGTARNHTQQARLSNSSVFITISASLIQMSPPCACSSHNSPTGSRQHAAFTTMCLESRPSTRRWVSLQLPWSPSRCHACSGQLTSPCERHPCDIFPPTSTAPSPLPHHLHPGVPWSCLLGVSHIRFFAMLRYSSLAPPSPSQFNPTRQREGHSGIQTGLGPDRHQMAGTVDHRHLLAIHHFIMHCHLSPSSGPHTRHPGYCIHHVGHLLHILLAHSSSPAHHSHCQVFIITSWLQTP